MKYFTFRQHPDIQAEPARLDALGRILQDRIRLILEG